MRKINEEKVALKISAILLLKNGEISIKDIRSIPFLKEDFNVKIIVNTLLKLYDSELVTKKIPSDSFLQWEEVIQLKNYKNKMAV